MAGRRYRMAAPGRSRSRRGTACSATRVFVEGPEEYRAIDDVLENVVDLHTDRLDDHIVRNPARHRRHEHFVAPGHTKVRPRRSTPA